MRTPFIVLSAASMARFCCMCFEIVTASTSLVAKLVCLEFRRACMGVHMDSCAAQLNTYIQYQ